MYATGVGLVLYGARNLDLRTFRNGRSNEDRTYGKVRERMKAWISNFF
jgi:cell division protein FtsA